MLKINSWTGGAVLFTNHSKKAEQVYGGIMQPSPDAAELRAWIEDEVELGARVASDFIEAGRCPSGAWDQHASEVLTRLYPSEDYSDKLDDEYLEYRRERIRQVVAKRRAVPGWGGRKLLCREDSHFRVTDTRRDEEGNLVKGGYHCVHPKGTPLNGMFWTATIYPSTPDLPGGSRAPRGTARSGTRSSVSSRSSRTDGRIPSG